MKVTQFRQATFQRIEGLSFGFRVASVPEPSVAWYIAFPALKLFREMLRQ